jgi:Uma2 family endonuclease
MATATLERKLLGKRPTPSSNPQQVRFTVEQYHAIQDAGALSSLRRHELINGFIVEKAVPNPKHVNTVRKTKDILNALLEETSFELRIQDPVTLPDNEPEPDIAVVLAPLTRYAERHPDPGDIGLLVEVADSTLRDDRVLKTEIYATSGIPIYWIVNLVHGTIEVYTQPRKGTYRKRTDYTAADSIPVVLGKKTLGRIPVKEFLP